MTSKSALCKEYGLTKSKFKQTLYFTKDDARNIKLFVLVQVDSYIYGGEEDSMVSFEQFLSCSFKMGEIERKPFMVYGSEIDRCDVGSIFLSQNATLNEISKFKLNDGATIHRGGRRSQIKMSLGCTALSWEKLDSQKNDSAFHASYCLAYG